MASCAMLSASSAQCSSSRVGRSSGAAASETAVGCLHNQLASSLRLGSGNNLRSAAAFTSKAPRAPRLSLASTVTARASGGRDRSDRGGEGEGDNFEERVVQVRRVTKVVKGGKQLSFRAVVVVGNERGKVGVGCAAAKEVVTAVQKAAIDAKRNLVTVPLTKNYTFPHRMDGIFGAAKVMLRPASEGTGVIAGGAVRVVLELAGVKNAFGKELGSPNPLNNARATLEGLKSMKTYSQVARDRNVSVAYLMKGSTMIEA